MPPDSLISVVTVLSLLVPTAVGALGVRDAVGAVYTHPRPFHTLSLGETSTRTYDPARPTVAVVLGTAGTNVADSLAPYEVFAATGAFNVYTVAAEARPVPLTGGLDLIPDFTFRELSDLIPQGADVIVVPQISTDGPTEEDPVVPWLRGQHNTTEPIIMSVCVGAKALAATGILDGRPATSHWLGLIGLRRSDPEVEWRNGVRFVDDGNVISTAGVLSGVDGSLRVVERLIGAGAARRAAEDLRWQGYTPGGSLTIRTSHPEFRDLAALLSAAYRWERPRTGVLLTENVGEIELASAFRPYTELSYISEMVALTVDGQPIRSRHGLTFVPRADGATAAREVDRLLVPGLAAARRAAARGLTGDDMTVSYLHQEDEFPFDGALRHIARTEDRATARWVAKSLEYPNTQPRGDSWPWSLTVRPLLLAALTVVAAVVVMRIRRRRASEDAAAIPR